MHMATDRTTLRMPDERKRRLDRAARIVAADEHDDPPMSEVVDAALQHLIESEQNLEELRGEDLERPDLIQAAANTSVLKFGYRTSVSSRWR